MALRINYIDFEIGDITTSISLKRYNRDSCTTFILEGYQLSYLEEYDLLEPQIYRSNTNNNFSIETEELIDLYFRVIAKDGDNMICSQPLAGNFFYHFNGMIQHNISFAMHYHWGGKCVRKYYNDWTILVTQLPVMIFVTMPKQNTYLIPQLMHATCDYWVTTIKSANI